MKKHNEGYSLVLVLVVLTLMSLVASFILSVSLKNLQSQTAAVSRMEDKYAAAGEIEKIVAKLEALGSTGGEIQLDNATIEKQADNNWVVKVKAVSNQVQIDCVLLLSGANVAEPPVGSNKYTITGLTGIEYLSYEVSSVEQLQGGGDPG